VRAKATIPPQKKLPSFFTFTAAIAGGLSAERLYAYGEQEIVEQIGRGLYWWADAPAIDQNLLDLAYRIPKGTLCSTPHAMSTQKPRPYATYCMQCEIWHKPHVKPVIWMGGTRENVRRFPETGQDSVGFELYRVQCGLETKDCKPMTSIGTGVKEIRLRDEAGIFRMICIATRPEGAYVLHRFLKKTRQTSRSDLELATKRSKSIGR
jgi:phage-related protein